MPFLRFVGIKYCWFSEEERGTHLCKLGNESGKVREHSLSYRYIPCDLKLLSRLYCVMFPPLPKVFNLEAFDIFAFALRVVLRSKP